MPPEYVRRVSVRLGLPTCSQKKFPFCDRECRLAAFYQCMWVSAMTEPSDSILIAAVARGETEALGTLYLRHGDRILRLIRYQMPREPLDLVEDVCQEVFMTAFHAAPRYKDEGKFPAWLNAIAIRVARSQKRKRWWRQKLFGRFIADEKVLRSDAEESVDAKLSQRQWLQQAIDRLPEAQREVLVMRFVEGWSGDEIARALDISENAVWGRLKRAYKNLREELEKMDVSSSETGGSGKVL
jgi:RNA polymerase sigma factor (sigma-70 family)